MILVQGLENDGGGLQDDGVLPGATKKGSCYQRPMKKGPSSTNPQPRTTHTRTAQRVEVRQICKRAEYTFIVWKATPPCSPRAGTRLRTTPLGASSDARTCIAYCTSNVKVNNGGVFILYVTEVQKIEKRQL